MKKKPAVVVLLGSISLNLVYGIAQVVQKEWPKSWALDCEHPISKSLGADIVFTDGEDTES